MRDLLKPYNGWTLPVGALGVAGFVLMLTEADDFGTAVKAHILGLGLIAIAALLGRRWTRNGKIKIDE